MRRGEVWESRFGAFSCVATTKTLISYSPLFLDYKDLVKFTNEFLFYLDVFFSRKFYT